MSATTATTVSITKPMSFDEMVKTMEEAKAMFMPPEWVLITPDGRVFKGDQREVARALLLNIDVTSLFGANK